MKAIDIDKSITKLIIKELIKKKKSAIKYADVFHQTEFSKEIQGKEFWIQNEMEHQLLQMETDRACCFWHIIGLPQKEHLVGLDADGREIFQKTTHPMFDYEMEAYRFILENRYARIKKARGMGITTLVLAMIAYFCVRNNKYAGSEMGIVTGPRQDLADEELERLVALFDNTDYRPEQIGDSVCINGCKITAYPSHTFDSARGLAKCVLFFVDEADFFPPNQIETVMRVLEGYEAKSHPYVILNSTTNLPTGLYSQMDGGKYPEFKTIEIFYRRGLDKIYTKYEIEQAKKFPSFEGEYNGQYGTGLGNIFPHQLIDSCIEQYDLAPGGGLKVLAVDPAYGSSKFAIVAAERIKKIIYIKDAQEFERPSPSAMVERLLEMSKDYSTVVVDNSDAGLIRELYRHDIDVNEVSFRSELSKMTMTAARYVKERKVKIHPVFESLISQLKAVRLNDRGHPDKRVLSFDLGDAFLMAVSHIELAYWGCGSPGLNIFED